MHPYLSELDGEILTDYADPEGKHLFLAFVDTVKKYGEGFVPYMWQWKDDPSQEVNKPSFVKGFNPGAGLSEPVCIWMMLTGKFQT